MPSQSSYPVAPWVNRQDERAEYVHLFERGEGWKVTVEPTIDGDNFEVVDWELSDYDGGTVWNEVAMFTVSVRLLDFIRSQFQQSSPSLGENE